jgi:hypothetical protein
MFQQGQLITRYKNYGYEKHTLYKIKFQLKIEKSQLNRQKGRHCPAQLAIHACQFLKFKIIRCFWHYNVETDA